MIRDILTNHRITVSRTLGTVKNITLVTDRSYKAISKRGDDPVFMWHATNQDKIQTHQHSARCSESPSPLHPRPVKMASLLSEGYASSSSSLTSSAASTFSRRLSRSSSLQSLADVLITTSALCLAVPGQDGSREETLTHVMIKLDAR